LYCIVFIAYVLCVFTCVYFAVPLCFCAALCLVNDDDDDGDINQLFIYLLTYLLAFLELNCELCRVSSAVAQMLYKIWCHSTVQSNI